MQIPKGIKFERQWLNHCCRIHAVAKELLTAHIGLTEAASTFVRLAIWTHAREDEDLRVFDRITKAFAPYPTGTKRTFWAAHALVREDVKIRMLEQWWHEPALSAAHNLLTKYAWALERRAELRRKQRQEQWLGNSRASATQNKWWVA
jgi:hypothetical protein